MRAALKFALLVLLPACDGSIGEVSVAPQKRAQHSKEEMARPSTSFDANFLPEFVDPPLFVYVRIPGEIGPLERGERFEDPLDQAMGPSGIGRTTGGGSGLSSPDAEGRRSVEYCGIDIDLVKPRAGVVLLIEELRKLNAPAGTTLEFNLGDRRFVIPLYAQGT